MESTLYNLLFVNATKIYQSKAKAKKNKTDMAKTELKGNVKFF